VAAPESCSSSFPSSFLQLFLTPPSPLYPHWFPWYPSMYQILSCFQEIWVPAVWIMFFSCHQCLLHFWRSSFEWDLLCSPYLEFCIQNPNSSVIFQDLITFISLAFVTVVNLK
jgi:hypothetical protein